MTTMVPMAELPRSLRLGRWLRMEWQMSVYASVRRAIGVIIAAVCLAMCIVSLPALAHAETVDAPVVVSDDATHLSVAKLDVDTHDWVVGAQMAIINAETGEVVADWTTAASVYQVSKKLDVNVHYILREVSAPEGYSKADDVVFYVKPSEEEGIEIVSGASDGNAELVQSYQVNVYDKSGYTEQVVTVSSDADGSSSPSSQSLVVAPKTGDETPLSLVAALAAVGVALIIVLGLVKKTKLR